MYPSRIKSDCCPLFNKQEYKNQFSKDLKCYSQIRFLHIWFKHHHFFLLFLPLFLPSGNFFVCFVFLPLYLFILLYILPSFVYSFLPSLSSLFFFSPFIPIFILLVSSSFFLPLFSSLSPLFLPSVASLFFFFYTASYSFLLFFLFLILT